VGPHDADHAAEVVGASDRALVAPTVGDTAVTIRTARAIGGLLLMVNGATNHEAAAERLHLASATDGRIELVQRVIARSSRRPQKARPRPPERRAPLAGRVAG
jgi:hypothetical protein